MSGFHPAHRSGTSDESGRGFVYTGHVEESLARLSIAQQQPFGNFEIPSYPRPGYGTLGKEVELLVNHFRLNMPDKTQVHHYRVMIQQIPKSQQSRGRGRGRGRGGPPPMPQPIKFRMHFISAFWAAIRRLRDCDRLPGVDWTVFDDFENAWLPAPYGDLFTRVDHPDEKCQRAWEVEVRLQFNCSYAININAANPATKQMSELFLKCLITQRVRYAPAMDARDHMEFFKNWDYAAGSMFKIPDRTLYGSAEDDKRKIFPGIRAWAGLNASAKPGEDGTYINLGIANRLYYFPEMDMITFFREVIIEERKDRMPDLETFKRELKSMAMSQGQRHRMTGLIEGLKVKTPSGGKGALTIDFGKPHRDPRRNKPPQMPFLGERHYKIIRIADVTAKTYQPIVPREFDYGHTMEQMYHALGYPLDYPNLPLVEVKQSASEELQPLEVLIVHDTPQRYAKQLEMAELRRYIRKMARKPSEYKEETDMLIRRLKIMGPGVPFLEHYAISLDPNWTSCTGRVLEPPIIRDIEGKPAKMLSNRTYQAKELTAAVKEVWMDVVITYCPRTGDPVFKEDERDRPKWFYDQLVKAMKDRGLSLIDREPRVYTAQAYSNQAMFRHETLDGNPEPGAFIRPDIPTLAAVMQDSKKQFEKDGKLAYRRHVMLFFTVWGSDFYGRIKSLGNNKLGIATQVVDAQTYYTAKTDSAKTDSKNQPKPSLTIFYSLALKINAKLGGVNMKVDLPQKLDAEREDVEATVMYVGIDVTHPGTVTRASAAPIDISLAAMVGSTDYWGTTYNTKIYAQMMAKETVECFDRQFVDLVWAFHEANKSFPQHVVVYRDGVSNSELLSTASRELGWIKGTWEQICSRVGDHRPPPPTYTYIVVQKRHRTRFVVPTRDGKEPYENPSPGTVVDKKVVSPQYYDFYLASHYGEIGTSRIAHYTVVYDEWKLTPDDVYAMTYRLAFLNARCRKPCALPAPVFYAHLACNQAREMYRSFVKDNPEPAFPNFGESLDSAQQRRVDLYRIERKAQVEQCLNAHHNYPGMHFV